jgi:hypothetical protein
MSQTGEQISAKKAGWDRLVRAGCGCMRFLQQLTGLGDEFRYFEGLDQVGDIIFLQEGALFAGAGGEGEQEVALDAGAVFFEPLVRFFGVPLAGHPAVHDDGVEMF